MDLHSNEMRFCFAFWECKLQEKLCGETESVIGVGRESIYRQQAEHVAGGSYGLDETFPAKIIPEC